MLAFKWCAKIQKEKIQIKKDLALSYKSARSFLNDWLRQYGFLLQGYVKLPAYLTNVGTINTCGLINGFARLSTVNKRVINCYHAQSIRSDFVITGQLIKKIHAHAAATNSLLQQNDPTGMGRQKLHRGA